jgi:hypothetical protein
VALLLRSRFWEWRSGLALKRVPLFNTLDISMNVTPWKKMTPACYHQKKEKTGKRMVFYRVKIFQNILQIKKYIANAHSFQDQHFFIFSAKKLALTDRKMHANNF